MNLFQLSVEFEKLMQKAEAYASENDGELPENIAEELDNLEISKKEKTSNLCRYIKSQKIFAENIKSEAKKMESRAKSIIARADKLKNNYLRLCLNGEKFKDEYSTVTYRNNKSVSVNCEVYSLDDKYIIKKIEEKPNKKALKEALESGKIIEGVEIIESKSVVLK